MDAYSHDWLSVLARSILCSTLGTALAAAMLSRFRVRSPRVHRLACFLVVLQGWLMFSWSIELQVQGVEPVSSTAARAIATSTVTESVTPSITVDEQSPKKSRSAVPWSKIMLVLWIAGAAMLGARLLHRYLSVARHMPFGRLPSCPEWMAEWRQVIAEFQLRAKVSFRMTDEIGPLLCYVPFAYRVLAPESLWCRLPQRERLAILKHECAHLARGDLWTSLAIRLLALPQWFNPCVWWAVRRFDEAGEWACDDLVIGRDSDANNYAKALLHVAEMSLPSVGAVGAQGGVLSRRIGRLLNVNVTEDQFMKKTIVPFVLLMLSLGQVIQVRAVADEERSRIPAAEPQAPQELKHAGAAPESRRSQLRRAGLDPYVIAPPDILMVDSFSGRPNRDVELRAGDVIQIAATGDHANQEIVGRFEIKPDGQVSVEVGEERISVKAAGMTLRAAARKLKKRLARAGFASPVLALDLVSFGDVQGEHLVQPDGTINLGRFGGVSVSSLTAKQAKKAIERQLSDKIELPKIGVRVHLKNSKFAYVLLENSGRGDHVLRVPCHPESRVLDALSLPMPHPVDLSSAEIWISRPGVASEQKRVVDWQAISRGAKTASNYYLLPGDRVFVKLKRQAITAHPALTPTRGDYAPAAANANAYGPETQPRVRMQISIVRDRDGNLDEFSSLRQAPLMLIDTGSALGTLRILARNELIEILSRPQLMCLVGQSQTADILVGEETPVGAKAVDRIELQLLPKLRDDSILVEAKSSITVDGRSNSIASAALVAPGKTVIMRAKPAKAEQDGKPGEAIYVVVTPELVR